MTLTESIFNLPISGLAYDLAAWPFVFKAREYIKDSLKGTVQPGDSILEVGIGTGMVSTYLAEELSLNVDGIDSSLRMLEMAKSRTSSLKAGSVALYQGKATDLPVSGPYKAVVMSYLLRHLGPEDLPKAFSECARVTNRESRLIIVDLYLPKPGPQQVLGVWSGHDPDSLIAQAREGEFEVVEVKKAIPSIFLTFIKKAT
mgnify:FL=1